MSLVDDKDAVIPLVRDPEQVKDGKRPTEKFKWKYPNATAESLEMETKIEVYLGLPTCDKEAFFMMLTDLLEPKRQQGVLTGNDHVGNANVPSVFADTLSLLDGSQRTAFQAIWKRHEFARQQYTFRIYKDVIFNSQFITKNVCAGIPKPYRRQKDYVLHRTFLAGLSVFELYDRYRTLDLIFSYLLWLNIFMSVKYKTKSIGYVTCPQDLGKRPKPISSRPGTTCDP